MSIAPLSNEQDGALWVDDQVACATILTYPGPRHAYELTSSHHAEAVGAGLVETAEGAVISTGLGRRMFDLLITFPLALITLPFLLVASLASALSFRATPFFSQDRLGQGGRRFRFTKIRSLPPETPAAADKYTIAEVRNTRTGALLRRSKLDELPQLWLVVRGQMSLVGPRPEMPELAATFDPEFVEARLRVCPGVTGLWQVSEACNGLIGEAPEYDLWYLENRTWRLDLWIVWRTLRLLLPGGGFIELADVPAWCTNRDATRTNAAT